MTGVRRPPVGRRRIRGAHRGLKRMLAEGMRGSNDQPYTWKEFSDAMVRQSVGDAVRALPVADAQVLKLAYFGGLSNEEIARRLDLTVAAVERRLREALDHISEHVERGRSHGRRGIGAVVVWLSDRWVSDVHHILPAGAAVAAATIIALSPTPGPNGPGGAGSATAPALASGGAVGAVVPAGRPTVGNPAKQAGVVVASAAAPAAPPVADAQAVVGAVAQVPAVQVPSALPAAVGDVQKAVHSVKVHLPFRV